MKALNKFIGIGQLGADPESKYTAQGTLFVRFSIAINRTWRDAEGGKREEVEWVRCVVWDKLAEICSQYLTKGAKVYIEGRLQTRSWDSETTGKKEYMTEIVLSDMIMLDSKASVDQAEDEEPEPALVPPTPRTQPQRQAPPQQQAQQPIRPTGGRRPPPTYRDDEDLF